MLQIDNLVFDSWGRRFFDRASVTIPDGTKVGLVGRNGVGKSTLFKLIVGELAAQEGDILLPKAAKIGSVDQEHPATPVTLLDTILAADTRREALNAAIGDRRARAPGRDLPAPQRHRRRPRAGARRRNLERARILQRRSRAADGGILRRLAHARGAGRGFVRRARSAAARRADQLPRSRRRAVARSAVEEISQNRAHRQPRPRASRTIRSTPFCI